MKKVFKLNLKHFLTVLITVVGIFLLLPQAVPSIESDHDCTGHDCAICEVIRNCSEINKNEILTPVKNVTIEEKITFEFVERVLSSYEVYIIDTLITLKTKISS